MVVTHLDRHESYLRDVDGLASGYQRTLQERTDTLHREATRALRRRLDEDEEDAITGSDAASALAALGALALSWRRREAPSEAPLSGLFGRADAVATKTARSSVGAALGGGRYERLLLDLPAADPMRMRDDFIKANVQLITSIDARYLSDVAALVKESARDGRSWTWLSDRLRERHGVSRSRGQLVARDQLGRLTGQLTEARNLELGVESYQRLTSGDERVRRSHAALAGGIFRWDDPPSVGHPGEDFQCRCTSRAVVSAEHAAELRRWAERSAATQRQTLARSPILSGEVRASAGRRLSPARMAELRGRFAA